MDILLSFITLITSTALGCYPRITSATLNLCNILLEKHVTLNNRLTSLIPRNNYKNILTAFAMSYLLMGKSNSLGLFCREEESAGMEYNLPLYITISIV